MQRQNPWDARSGLAPDRDIPAGRPSSSPDSKLQTKRRWSARTLLSTLPFLSSFFKAQRQSMAAVRFLATKNGSSVPGLIQLHLRVKPQASQARQGILAVTSSAVELCVAAPPRRGEANDAVLQVLSRATGVPTSRLRIVRGLRSRDKIATMDCQRQAQCRRCHHHQQDGPVCAETILGLLREASSRFGRPAGGRASEA
ncbi:hypothetical protein E4U41_003064 [Claviceps citrina]|nr:hypothetical protein E4U41_003064 [Claviceps citrina]